MEPNNGKLKIKKVRRFISEQELLADLREASLVLQSEFLSTRDYDRAGCFNSSTVISRFGSWNNALGRAGLRIKRPARCSKKELLENLLVLWQALGRQPKQSDIKYSGSKFSKRVYLKVFGSWNNTLNELEEFSSVGRNARKLARDIKNSTGKRDILRTPGLKLRICVLKRDRFRCVLCGASPAANAGIELEIDHILPWSKGGETKAENLQTLCSSCNKGKSDDTL